MNVLRLHGFLGLVLLLSACRSSEAETGKSRGEATYGGGASAAVGPLTLEAAREAHRRAELRRHLRFLEAIDPGQFLRRTARVVTQSRIDAGELSIAKLREIGRLLFEHEYGFVDGLGGAASRRRRTAHESPFRRVHAGRFGGPETISCTSCHWRGGSAGSGGISDNSFLYGDGDDVESADARNPPPLQGVGVVELLAREMSTELAATRASLIEEARRHRVARGAVLKAKGVSFGELFVAADGTVDTSRVEGVDADLVIRPFGWKGTFATLRGFVAESLQVHHGIQSEDSIELHRRIPDPDLLGRGTDLQDPDDDGVVAEFSSGQLTALVSFLALREIPVVRPPETLHDAKPIAKNIPAPTPTVFLDEWRRGREFFADLGCARCHVPMMVLRDPVFRTRSETTGGVLEIDLSKHGAWPRLRYDERLGGYPVWLFSDLKRHDLGEQNASRHVDHGVAPQQYLTRRLWGLANSSPYFYDGRAPSLDDAITAHEGEALASSESYKALGFEEQGALRVYLLSLARARRLMVP